MRSCLNTIQFLAKSGVLRRNSTTINVRALANKDRQENLYTVMDYLMNDRDSSNNRHLLKEVRDLVSSIDSQLLNEAIYENIAMSQFYDDLFERSAYLMDCLSRSDI